LFREPRHHADEGTVPRSGKPCPEAELLFRLLFAPEVSFAEGLGEGRIGLRIPYPIDDPVQHPVKGFRPALQYPVEACSEGLGSYLLRVGGGYGGD